MKKKTNYWIRPTLFTIGGALLGLVYYYVVGCASGSCIITSNPVITMFYTGLIGWLVSGSFVKEGKDTCNM